MTLDAMNLQQHPPARVEPSVALESYSAPNASPGEAIPQAITEVLPDRWDSAAKPMTRPQAVTALFGPETTYSMVRNWRTRRRAPAWALQILAEKLEARAKRCLELAKALRSLCS